MATLRHFSMGSSLATSLGSKVVKGVLVLNIVVSLILSKKNVFKSSLVSSYSIYIVFLAFIQEELNSKMVSAKVLLALYAIAGVVRSYPIHRPIEDSSESHLTTRSPSPVSNPDPAYLNSRR